MMAEFLRDMTADPRFTNSDVAYIWITNSDDLAMQSKNKLWNYYGGAGEITLLTSTDVKDGKLFQNSVFFVNWQKLVQDALHNGKAEALLHWLADKPGFDGGIVEQEAGIWKIYRSKVQEEILDTQIACEERAPYFYKVNLEL
jgi:hypothetical protein